MTISVRPTTPEQDAQLIRPIAVAFGFDVTPERYERLKAIPELTLRLGAFDGDDLVGCGGSWSFAMTTPGGTQIDVEGLTLISVLPTHRRRGALTSLVRAHFDEARARGKAVSSLFATEGSIYGRFGYGLASLAGHIELDHRSSAFLGPAPTGARFHLLDHEAAARAFPPIWEHVRAATPGMCSRSDAWWRQRRLSDISFVRGGRPALRHLLCEIDGRPAGYALYRFATTVVDHAVVGSLEVVEAVGDSAAATRAVWRYLCDVDLVRTIKADLLPIDHPLLHLVAEPTALGMSLHDALWIRLVDVAAALSQRGYEAEGPPLNLGVTDAFCPWNQGSYRLHGGKAERTTDPPDITLDAAALGSAYLGAFSFTRLSDAGRAVEHTPGALRRADGLFRSARAPWCPEIF